MCHGDVLTRNCAIFGMSFCFHVLRDTEVTNSNLEIACNEDVQWLDVAMKHLDR